MDVNFLLEIAIKETINLKTNEVFLLRELFKGYEWNRIERKDRLLLGSLFRKDILRTTKIYYYKLTRHFMPTSRLEDSYNI